MTTKKMIIECRALMTQLSKRLGEIANDAVAAKQVRKYLSDLEELVSIAAYESDRYVTLEQEQHLGQLQTKVNKIMSRLKDWRQHKPRKLQ